MPEPLTVRGAIPHIGLAERLLIARRYAGLEQRQLGAMIGVSARSIYAAESGRSRPRRPVLVSWAMATGVSLEWIVDGDLIAAESPQAGAGVRRPGLWASVPGRAVSGEASFGGMAGRPPGRGPAGRPPGRPRPRLGGFGRGAGPVNDYQTFTGLS